MLPKVTHPALAPHPAWPALPVWTAAALLLAAAAAPAHADTGIDFMRRVHAEYRKLYGTEMPIDVYMIHGYVTHDWSVAGFQTGVRAFRAFMREQGLRDKPLWMKEFSPLGEPSPAALEQYMRGTVGFMATAADPALGPSWDGGRLVQKWAWFVLQDGEAQYEGQWDNVALFDADARFRKPLGAVYADLAAQALARDYPNPAFRPAAHPRFGVGSGVNATHTWIGSYDYRSLRIGWYFDWGSSADAPPGLDYMPLVGGWRPWAPSANLLEALGTAYPSGTVFTLGNELSFDDGRTARRYAQDHHDTYVALKEAGRRLGKTFLLATGAVLPTSNLYYANLPYRNADGRPDLFAIRRRVAGSPRTLVNVATSDGGFAGRPFDRATILAPVGSEFEFGMGDWNRDGAPDVFAIKKWYTGQRRTEVHVLDGATEYARWLLQIPTALHETGGEGTLKIADWNRDGVPDLWYIKKFWTGTNRTEVHILDGASSFQRFLLQTGTALVPTYSEAAFTVADWDRDGTPDLWYVKKHNTGTNRTEVHILNGRDGFRTFLTHTGTALHVTGDEADFAAADHDGDGRPDLWYVKRWGGGSGRTELHVLSSASGFQQFVAHIATSLEPATMDDAFLGY